MQMNATSKSASHLRLVPMCTATHINQSAETSMDLDCSVLGIL